MQDSDREFLEQLAKLAGTTAEETEEVVKDTTEEGRIRALNFRPISGRDFSSLAYISMTEDVLDFSLLPELEHLDSYTVPFAGLDFSANPRLKRLDCLSPVIQYLGIEQCADLESLSVGLCGLGQINVSGNRKLKSLYLRRAAMQKLDISANAHLSYLCVEDNVLDELDISNNPRLFELKMKGNGLRRQDITHREAQKYLIDEVRKKYKLRKVPQIDIAEFNTYQLHNLAISQYKPISRSVEKKFERLPTYGQIVDHDECDYATALMIYWHLPHYRKRKDRTDEMIIALSEFTCQLEARLLDGEFGAAEIYFSPTEDCTLPYANVRKPRDHTMWGERQSRPQVLKKSSFDREFTS